MLSWGCLCTPLSQAVKSLGACLVSCPPLFETFWLTTAFSGRREILDGMLGANLVCFQVGLERFHVPFISPYCFCRPIHTRDILHQLVSEFADMKQLRAVSMSMAGSPSSVIVPSGSMRNGSPRICELGADMRVMSCSFPTARVPASRRNWKLLGFCTKARRSSWGGISSMSSRVSYKR